MKAMLDPAALNYFCHSGNQGQLPPCSFSQHYFRHYHIVEVARLREHVTHLAPGASSGHQRAISSFLKRLDGHRHLLISNNSSPSSEHPGLKVQAI